MAKRSHTEPSKRRPLRAALVVVFLAAGAFAASQVNGALGETALREAYLPDLEARAARTPYDGRLQALLGGRLIEAASFPAAAEALRNAAAAGEDDPEIWINLAAVDAMVKGRSAALADLLLGLKANPGSQEIAEAGGRAEGLGGAPHPMALMQAISPAGPGRLIDRRTQGSFLNGFSEWRGRAQPERSGFATRQAWVNQEPENPTALRLWAQALLRNRRYPDAVPAAERALEETPTSPEARLILAQALAGEGASARAALEYLKCLGARPDWEPALVGLGEAVTRLGLPGFAVDLFERGARLFPSSVDVHLGRARAFLEAGAELDQAVAAFETAGRLAPQRTDFLVDWANALRQTTRGGQAENLLRRRLTQTPGDSYAHFVLGRVLMDHESTPEREAAAETEFRESLRLSPGNPNPNGQLGRLLLRRGEAAAAIHPLRETLRAKPFDEGTMRTLARALHQTGKTAEGAPLAARADAILANRQRASLIEEQLRSDRTNVDKRLDLAGLYERTGKPEKAREQQERVRRIRAGEQDDVDEHAALRKQVQDLLGRG